MTGCNIIYICPNIKETVRVSPKKLYKKVATHFSNTKFINNPFQQFGNIRK